MRRKWESGLEPPQVRCAWIGALACIAMLGWVPATAWAEEPEGEPAPEDTAMDQADQAEVAEPVTAEDMKNAQEAIDEAQRRLDELKRKSGVAPTEAAPAKMPGGAGLVVGEDGTAKKLQVSLNKDGSLYLRFATWLQVWGRAIQLNPGTEVKGDDSPWYGDAAIRRARFLLFGQIFPRTFLVMHIGINNQDFRNARKPQVYFHDAWAQFQLSRNDAVYFGGGLIYWNGISRQTNGSTITAMSLDYPISNWPLIERSDQFARQLGFFMKGKFGLFDYRIAVTRPFTPFDVDTPVTGAVTPPALTPTGNYRDTNAWAYQGYFMLQFLDHESNVLPYTVGTYIGAKKVFNLGFGAFAHPWAVQYGTGCTQNPDGSYTCTGSKVLTNVIAAGDLFLDIPFKAKNGGAATWYAVYQYQEFGPNALRNVGIMNPADAGTGVQGGGNAYPLIGTGHTIYSELGILLPFTVGEEIQFQPYVNWQGSGFEAFGCAGSDSGSCNWMHHVGIGMNMFVHKHNAKVSFEYRNRPIFVGGEVDNRKGNSFILQMHLFI